MGMETNDEVVYEGRIPLFTAWPWSWK